MLPTKLLRAITARVGSGKSAPTPFQRVVMIGKNLKGLSQRQAGIDHDGELARENRELLLIHARAERGDVEFLPLFGELVDVDVLPPEHCLERRLALGFAFARNGGAHAVDSPICEYRHDLFPPCSIT